MRKTRRNVEVKLLRSRLLSGRTRLVLSIAAPLFTACGSTAPPDPMLADALSIVDGSPGNPSGPRFRSGFGGGVAVVGPLVSPSSRWIAELSGTDLETGFAWPADLPAGRVSSRFYFNVDGAEKIETIVETRLDGVTGPAGEQTTALYQAVLQDHQSVPSRARNMFSLMNDAEDSLKQGQVSYWLKLQPNLEAVLPPRAWRQFIEWRETDNRWRMAVNIKRNRETGKLHWTVHGDFGPTWDRAWDVSNDSIPVPVGEWFLFEAYWHQGTTDGRLLVKINCQTIADHVGRTQSEGPLESIHVFKVYTGADSLALGPAYQWIDDVEFRDELTPTICP